MMDMTRDAMNRIIELAAPNIHEIDGRKYSDKVLQPIKPPEIKPINLHTLGGLLELHKETTAKTIALIESPTCVKLIGDLDPVWKTYPVHAEANCFPFAFEFGRYYPQSEFVVKLQTNFSNAGDRAAALKQVGNVTEESGTKQEDDGFTQVVTVKKGARFENEKVLEPMLAPLRTFHEIIPLEFKFVLRHKNGAQFALFDSNGDRWEFDTVAAIAEYLKEQVPTLAVLY